MLSDCPPDKSAVSTHPSVASYDEVHEVVHEISLVAVLVLRRKRRSKFTPFAVSHQRTVTNHRGGMTGGGYRGQRMVIGSTESPLDSIKGVAFVRCAKSSLDIATQHHRHERHQASAAAAAGRQQLKSKGSNDTVHGKGRQRPRYGGPAAQCSAAQPATSPFWNSC